MSTPFDIEAVDMLYKIGVGGYKVASCDRQIFLDKDSSNR